VTPDVASTSDIIDAMKFSGDGPWELPLAGLEVGRLTFGLPIDVYLYGEGGSAQLRLPGPFEFQVPGDESRTVDPETHGWEEMTELLSLRHDRVTVATAWKDARLRVDFSSGRVISAHSTGGRELLVRREPHGRQGQEAP
jgi:hypothetical protein